MSRLSCRVSHSSCSIGCLILSGSTSSASFGFAASAGLALAAANSASRRCFSLSRSCFSRRSARWTPRGTVGCSFSPSGFSPAGVSADLASAADLAGAVSSAGLDSAAGVSSAGFSTAGAVPTSSRMLPTRSAVSSAAAAALLSPASALAVSRASLPSPPNISPRIFFAVGLAASGIFLLLLRGRYADAAILPLGF